MSPARLAFEDLPQPSFTSGGLWTSSKPLLSDATKSSLQSSPLPPPPRSQPQQQQPHHHQHQEEHNSFPDAQDDLAEDIHTLWNTNWKHACRRRQHPFQDASYLDFAPLFASFAAQGVTSARSPAYTSALVAAARHLAAPVDADTTVLLRACALLRVAREGEDEERDELKREAHRLQQEYHRRAVDLLRSAVDSPLDEVLIPHLHRLDNDVDARSGHDARVGGGVREAGAGRRQQQQQQQQSSSGELSRRRQRHLPLLVRVPLQTLCTGELCPAAVVLARDRTGATRTCEAVLARGWAAVVVEVEGKEGSHVEEEQDAARACASVLDWMRAVGFYDMSRVVAIGEDGDVAVRAAAAMPSLGARFCGVVARLGEQYGEEEAVAAAPAPGCPVLAVRGASRAVTSNGLWTPVGELRGGEEDEEDNSGEGEGEDLVALSAYGAGSRVCVGALETADGERAYDWMDDVMEGREPRLPAPVAIPVSFCDEGDKGRRCSSARPMPEWFSREATPPDSDVEMGSVCGSSL